MKRYLFWLFTFFLLLRASGTIVATPQVYKKILYGQTKAKQKVEQEDAKSQYDLGAKCFAAGDYKNARCRRSSIQFRSMLLRWARCSKRRYQSRILV